MRVQLLRYAAGAVAGGLLAAAAGAFVLPAGNAGWRPVTYGLTQSPEELLPATVTAAQPARVVSTTIDADGRPVVTVQEATDKSTATALVKAAQQAEGAVSVEMDAPVHALGAPIGSDPYRSQQWDLTKMRVADAWQKSTGAGVTVAVIDTGVDPTHPDLKGKVLNGYDAITNKAGASRDGNGHGTHVAGTIAAVTGNDVGVSAVAPDTRILPVKVLSDSGSGVMSDTAEGIVWAADNGAQVINMSLGSTSKVAAVSNAIAYARSKGVTVIAAAGNARQQGSPISYPGADAGVIAVAATDSADKVASYSNAGGYVDVTAPGSAIISTYPAALGKAYASMNGTSMASPHVAAAAALLKAYQPHLTPDQIELVLEKSAVDLGTKGFDNDHGYGRIDAAAALAAVMPVTTAPTTPTMTAPTASVPATAPTTSGPTETPSESPSATPSESPSATPSGTPSASRTASPAPSVAPTSAKPKLNPLITSNVTTREVVYGSSTATTFTIRVSGSAWAKKPVQLCISDVCTGTQTTSTGTVLVTRAATAGYKVQVRLAETDTTLAAMSPTAIWTVRATVTASLTSRGVMLVVLNGVNGQNVQIQQYSSTRGWETIGAYAAVQKMTVSGLRAGQKYRAVVPGTATILGATSNTISG
ncbi:S8 family peptidase [Actinoplanes derwentensis]|uniref:Type VII secretion-associated serine protease mycosin n=1 Tax=Actinoplanes derwentensis TaxID=113562 RepID=A0A1H2D936_9ACTN|nr:S8 family peptidase [Actinoplanes derwentensis]GID86396.1 hypothetical protein Ade03nite_53200 [Actinoplanes derwentensis]SDT79104.1 type VII secretion-associated serine protease mycosin [Actinoplanes derwentensis]